MRKKFALFLVIFSVLPLFLTGCGKSESPEDKICKKYSVQLNNIESKSKLLSLNPDVAPGISEVLDIGFALLNNNEIRQTKSHWNYGSVVDFLNLTGSCMSDDAIMYLENYFKLPGVIVDMNLDNYTYVSKFN